MSMPQSGIGLIEACKRNCQARPGLVAFPDSLDPRALKAALRLKSQGLAEPLLLGSPFAMREKLQKEGLESDVTLACLDYANPDVLEQNARQFVELRQEKGRPVSHSEALQAMRCPLACSAMLLRRGEVEVCVAGNLSSTADVLRTGLAILPKKPGIKTVSSFFLMLSPSGSQRFVFADCAVVPEPGPEVLADIALSAAQAAKTLLGEEPRVAMLSFSSKGSSSHPKAAMVREAVELARSREPSLCIDGELQFDAASLPEVALSKAPGSPLEGRANVFVFPSLEAGNIGYKMVERLAGFSALGPFLQGFAASWHDLSRGCSADDIYNAAIVGRCLAENDPPPAKNIN